MSSISGQSKKSELNPLKIHLKYLHILENQLSASPAAISHQQPSVISSYQPPPAISDQQPSATQAAISHHSRSASKKLISQQLNHQYALSASTKSDHPSSHHTNHQLISRDTISYNQSTKTISRQQVHHQPSAGSISQQPLTINS